MRAREQQHVARDVAHASKHAVDHARGAREVARVFEDGDEEEEQADLRQEDDHGGDADRHDERRAEDAHEPREHDQIRRARVDRRGECGVERVAGEGKSGKGCLKLSGDF